MTIQVLTKANPVLPRKVLVMPLYVDRKWTPAHDSKQQLAFINGNALANRRLFTADVVKVAKDGSSITVHCAEACGRCDGKQVLNWALHVDKGVCFACNGEGVVWKNKRLYTRAKVAKLNAIAEAKRIRKEQEKNALRAAAIAENGKLVPDTVLTEVLAWREKLLTEAGFYLETENEAL